MAGTDKSSAKTALDLQEIAAGVFGGGNLQRDCFGWVREEGVSAALNQSHCYLGRPHGGGTTATQFRDVSRHGPDVL